MINIKVGLMILALMGTPAADRFRDTNHISYDEIKIMLLDNETYTREIRNSDKFTDDALISSIFYREDNPHCPQDVKIARIIINAIIKYNSENNICEGMLDKIPVGYEQIFIDDLMSHNTQITELSKIISDRYLNIDCGILYFNILTDKYKGDYTKVIQAFNMGEQAIDSLVESYGVDWDTHRDEKDGDPEYLEKIIEISRRDANYQLIQDALLKK